MFFLQNMRQVKTGSLDVSQGIDPIIGASFQGNPGHHQDDMPLGRVFVGFFNHGTFEAKKCRPQKDPTKFKLVFHSGTCSGSSHF